MNERTCCTCGRAEDRTLNERGKWTCELRPYGPGGTDICYQCATGSPAAEAQTKAAFGALLDAHEALPGITTLSADGLGKLYPTTDANATDLDAALPPMTDGEA